MGILIFAIFLFHNTHHKDLLNVIKEVVKKDAMM